MNWNFDDHSSGFYSHYFGKTASKTIGSIALRFSNEESFTMGFNVNDKNFVKMADLKATADLLKSKLENGQLSTKECLAYIHDIETMEIGSKIVGIILTFIC